MSTTKTQRIVTFILAMMFLGSTIGIVAYYILAVNSQENTQVQTQSAGTQSSSGQKLVGTNLKNFTPIAKVSSLQIADTVVGSGTAVKAGDTVTVDYTGAIASTGVIFDSSAGANTSFSLNQVISGFAQGLQGMKVGGTRQILIPASLAYGTNPPQGSSIPANADLVFDIQLIKIGQ